MYTPKRTESYEALVKLAAAEAMASRPMFSGPVRVRIGVMCTIPMSYSRRDREAALHGRTRPTTKPDIDNVVKAVFDAMNGIVFPDDRAVVSVHAWKQFAANPRVMVEVAEWGCV
jgi:Holliday junction resolvase RusA-like endonuclease